MKSPYCVYILHMCVVYAGISASILTDCYKTQYGSYATWRPPKRRTL